MLPGATKPLAHSKLTHIHNTTGHSYLFIIKLPIVEIRRFSAVSQRNFLYRWDGILLLNRGPVRLGPSVVNSGIRRHHDHHHRHYSDVIMNVMAYQITGVWIVYSTVCSGADQRKHQSSVSLAFVRGIHRSPVNSPHKWPVTRKMFPFDDVFMQLGDPPPSLPSPPWPSKSGPHPGSSHLSSPSQVKLQSRGKHAAPDS